MWVTVLMKMVADSLGSSEQVWRMVANGTILLADTSIEKSLVDGDIVTVLTKPTSTCKIKMTK